MANDIDCHERSDELVCEINGDWVFVNELTKDQCQRTGQGEWIRGHDRVQDWSRVSSPETKRILKQALRNDVDLVKSMSQQDNPPIQPDTAEAIQDSYQPSVAGACRYGRDRAADPDEGGQPSSYNTDTIESQTDDTTEEITPEEARETFDDTSVQFEGTNSPEDFGL